MKYFLAILLAATLAPVANAATILSSVRTLNLAEGAPTYPITSPSDPVPIFGPWFASWGTVTVQSAADEDILNVILTYTKLPHDVPGIIAEQDMDISAYPWQGTMTIPPTDNGSGLVETWSVNWFAGGAYFLPPGQYYGPYLREPIQLPGIATLSVVTTSGTYDLASYPYTYLGIVPEASTAVMGLASLVGLACRRKRQ